MLRQCSENIQTFMFNLGKTDIEIILKQIELNLKMTFAISKRFIIEVDLPRGILKEEAVFRLKRKNMTEG